MYLKSILVAFFVLSVWTISAQIEEPVRLSDCNQEDIKEVENCFYDNIMNLFTESFQLPENLKQKGYSKDFSVVFIATKQGDFEVLYISPPNADLSQEVDRVFARFPAFQPATFNKHPIDKQFVLPYSFGKLTETVLENKIPLPKKKAKKRKIILDNSKFHSTIQIPLSHANYRGLNSFEFGNNTHTAVKPYTYTRVSQYVAFDSIQNNLAKNKNTWLGRKFWNENMLAIQGDNYWFHLDPVADLQLGKDDSDQDFTYNNTRAIQIEGGLGSKIGFSSTLFESQGRFADYFNDYAHYIKPTRDGYAIVPGRDISKEFKGSAFDYPLVTGYLSVQPIDMVNIQFGHDRNFIGDGYRSLFLSDVGAPYTFLKINTTFWKIKYTNTWTWLRDTNVFTDDNEPYKRKFMAMHYLSWNATKKLNIGLFESVIWAKTEDRGFDVQYLNPVIFYRALEFSNGSKAGNALLGLSLNYSFNNKLKLYSQFILDELTISEFTKTDGWWANKYGVQIGAKYYDAFKIPNLFLQAEYNTVKPYTYSHNETEINYGHVNQPLAHLWGSNFHEFTFIADYQKNRWFGDAKLTTGIKGFDYNSESDSYSYGGDIYRDNQDRFDNYGISTGQGNKATILIGELKAGYLLNPATNLKIFGSVLVRDFKTPVTDPVFENKMTTWFNLGFRTDINNWYFDF